MSESFEISTHRLGFAAYLHMSGARFLRKSAGAFVFESEREKCVWERDFINSESARFDAALLQLKKIKDR